MGTKMKGVLKGLRYITQIFEDEKEPEMQIGFPTDVKHVAHIGWDGPSPSVDNSPSWMKEYKVSGPQTTGEEGKANPDLRWGSQDSLSQRGLGPQTSPHGDFPDLPKPARRHSLADSSSISSPKGSKSRQSRRNSSDSSKKSSRKQKDTINSGSEFLSQTLPDLPKKKSSRKKSKESVKEGSSKSRKKEVASFDSCPSPFSDPGQDNESEYDMNRLVQSLSLRPSVNEDKW